MLNRRSTSASLALCTLLSVAPVAIRADAASDAKAAIQAVYNKETAAVNKKDVKGSLAIYAPDYVEIGLSGKKRSLAETKKQMQSLFEGQEKIKLKQTITKVTLAGNQATVLVKQHLEMTIVEPQTQTKLISTSDARVEDIWVKSGKSGWLKKQSKTLSEKATVDGKPVQG